MGRDRAWSGSRSWRTVLLQGTAVLLVGASAACGPERAPEDALASTATELRLVALGDSIPNNSPEDCPGCTGFVDRYACSIEAATGRPVEVRNLSQHNNLTLPGLVAELDGFRTELAQADVVVVGIAHNTIELNADEPCGAALQGDSFDWTAMTTECAETSAANARAQYEQLFADIRDIRVGKPMLLRTINRYNDWIGWEDGDLTPEQERITAEFISRWNAMLCETAAANGFACADISTAFNGADGTLAAGDLLAADYTHPSDKGNTAIADVLASLGFSPLAG